MLLKECLWLADENICQEAIRIFSEKLDSDFGKLIFANKQAFLGVVYLRPGHLLARYHVDTLERLLSEEILLVPPFLIVAEKSNNQIKVRVRNDLVIN